MLGGLRLMSDCLACDLTAGVVPVPGGLIFETEGWRVEHCVGPLGVGTLVVKPKRHVLYLADITENEAREMGPLLRNTATAVRELTKASQVYVCLWSHGPVHIHYVVQPALPETIAEFGVYGPRMQAAMFARGGSVDAGAAAAFAERARSWFAHRA
jgi:diadenosine tetraphosphate (Ap4A) HIT family hydrolase